jgi:hypothetical protein
MARIKVRRTHREELPGVAVLRDAVAEAGDGSQPRRPLDLDMELDPVLEHLLTHDPHGFLTALDRDETVGFAAAHIRSRQWVLSELWVLSQHQGKGAGEALLVRTLGYGESSGAREFFAIVPALPAVQSLLLRHGFAVLTPIYLFRIPVGQGNELGRTLSRLLPGQDVTAELLNRRGQADLDRIDRLTRNTTREIDHQHWLKDRRMGAAFVRQGARIAAYAYGGHGHAGPIAGATQDAALSGLGWAIELALRHHHGDWVEVRVPGRFEPAIEMLLDGGARLHTTQMLYARGLSASFDRSTFGPAGLP